jgi:hypothetical protein
MPVIPAADGLARIGFRVSGFEDRPLRGAGW